MFEILASEILPKVAPVKGEPVSGFLAMKGRNYSRQLMVVGRATNGWGKPIEPSELLDPGRCRTYAMDVHDFATGNALNWVTESWLEPNGYVRRSPFWRTIRAAIGQLKIADVDNDPVSWPTALVWSNLYKVAPAKKGNPKVKLQRAQFHGCKKLFRLELDTYHPDRLLLLTGRSWADPFLPVEWQEQKLSGKQNFVERKGQIKLGRHAVSTVIACHPQGKPEAAWVEEVVAAFG